MRSSKYFNSNDNYETQTQAVNAGKKKIKADQ
jgi:hypothetical protein